MTSAAGPMVALPPLTHTASLQFFDREASSFPGVAKEEDAEHWCYFSALMVASTSAPGTQGAPAKTSPALWSDSASVLPLFGNFLPTEEGWKENHSKNYSI